MQFIYCLVLFLAILFLTLLRFAGQKQFENVQLSRPQSGELLYKEILLQWHSTSHLRQQVERFVSNLRFKTSRQTYTRRGTRKLQRFGRFRELYEKLVNADRPFFERYKERFEKGEIDENELQLSLEQVYPCKYEISLTFHLLLTIKTVWSP
jgi:hypothetical protein